MMIIWRTIKSRLSGVDLFRYKKVFFLLLFLFAIFFPFSSARAWYDGSWTYRKTVTFTNSASTENLTNFPILVKLTASNFDFTKAQSAGQDIRFVDSDDSSLLKYEIEKWDNAGQEAIVWVKVPQVDDSDTDFIYMYYGNGAATDGQDAPNVWTNSYMAVFHFAEQSSSYLDSSSNDVDCPTVSATRSATGKFGYAPDFNGSSNRLDCDASVTLGDMSQEAWVNVDTFTTFRPLVQHAAAAETEVTNIVYGFEIDTSANLWQQWEHSAGTNITNTSTATVSASTWTHVGTNRDTTANTVTWYRNGSATGSASSYVTDPTGGSSGALYIGGRISSAMWFDGKIDELRISSVNRSASWMNASYLTMSTSYQTYGTEEENSSASLSLSSAANQVFAVNDATTTISTITITEGDTPTITATNNIRVQIPAGFNMLWDTSDTTATIGGTASGKVSGTVSYEDSGRTLVLDVTSNLATLETVTISGLSFTSFSATSASDNLDLIVGGSGGSVVDADDKTLIVASPTMVSAANQTFEVGAGTTTISTITLTESATSATITATNNIRIQIPSGFNMVWDTSDTTATIGGTASGKVSTTVSYEDSGRTLVLDVTSNLATSETVTVAGLSFVSFSGASSADNLDLIIRGASSNVVISDTRTITIAVPTITVASSVSQPSGVANATTDNVLGVASVVRNMGTGSVTSVTIAESGTITANTELENIELWLSSDSSWSAGDNQLGSTGSFDGANGSVTFTETWALSTSTQYLIIRGDVTAGATLGDTIEISVSTMATTDTLSGTPLAIAGTTTIASDWWDDDWLYRRKLTIDNAGRTEHTTFPVMVKLTSSNFDFAKALSTGADLRFIDADGVTALSYEIEYYSTGSSTAYIWVKVPTITADSTTDYIHMYYGNSVASAGASPEDVWSNGYAAVYHFAEQSGQYLDSTSNSNDSNNVDLDYAVDSSRNNTSATGIGYFPKFNSNGTAGVPSTEGDHVAVPDANSMDFGTSSFALMARAKTPDDTFDSDLFRKGSTGIAENAWWKIEWGDQAVDNRLQYLIRVGGVDYSISYVLAPGANWRHIVGLRDVSGSPTIKLYIDGALISSVAASSGSVSNSANTGIGSKDTYNDDFFDGNLDEVRFSNVTRSADWIAAEYESLENTLLTFGSESGVPDTTAPTITNVSSDKTNATYTTGEVIDIDVTFSEAVTSTGNVTVTLETGTTDQTCTFTVSASTTGTCNYTVVSGDTSADLTVSTISGTIADASSNAMSNFVPTTNLAANKALVVDTTAPSAPDAPDMTAGTDSGVSTDNITSDTTPDFTISCESGTTVTLYDNVTSVGTGTCASSTVTITASALSEGTHATMNAKQTDVATNVSSASSNLSVTIDVTAPTITNVSSDKTNATYTTGEVIDIDVTFSEAVTSTGNVTVTLETGTTDQTCTFTVSASTTGTCNYTVVSGDTSADLTVSTISGTIADASSNAMSNFVPTTNLAANKALVVDTTAVIESVSSGRSGGGRRSISETSPSESVISPVTDTNTSILDAIIPDFFKKKPEIATSVTPSQEKSLSLENSWNYLNPSFVKNFILAPLPSELAVFIQKYPDLGRVFNKLNITTVADIDRLEGTSILLPKLANLKDLPTEIVIAGGGAGKVEVASTITLDENGKVEQKIQTTSNTSLVLAVKPSTPVDSINGYLLFKKSAQKSVVELPFNSQVASAMLAFEKNDNKTPAIPSRELLVQTFAYEDSNHDGIYTADIKTPAVEGTYEVVTIINYTDKNLGSKELRLVTVIDPEGYVYYLNANGDESRISKAVVSIFNASDDTLWDAVSYNQTNPQTTDASGKYSFLVPEGKYYITALKGGHRSYTSDVFEVKSGVGIHFNIELKNSGWLSVLDWKTAFFLLIILIISSTFIGYAVHEHALKRKLMRRN